MMMFGLYMCPASICSRERLYTIRKQAIGRSAFNGVQGVLGCNIRLAPDTNVAWTEKHKFIYK